MQRHNSEQLGDVLQQWLRQEGLETPLLQHRLVMSWPQVMGEAIERYTGEIYIRGEKLHVQIKSAPLRQNLIMMRSEIVRKLNEHVKAQIIQDIVFF